MGIQQPHKSMIHYCLACEFWAKMLMHVIFRGAKMNKKREIEIKRPYPTGVFQWNNDFLRRFLHQLCFCWCRPTTCLCTLHNIRTRIMYENITTLSEIYNKSSGQILCSNRERRQQHKHDDININTNINPCTGTHTQIHGAHYSLNGPFHCMNSAILIALFSCKITTIVVLMMRWSVNHIGHCVLRILCQHIHFHTCSCFPVLSCMLYALSLSLDFGFLQFLFLMISFSFSLSLTVSHNLCIPLPVILSIQRAVATFLA